VSHNCQQMQWFSRPPGGLVSQCLQHKPNYH
jgi:hypothetical protein